MPGHQAGGDGFKSRTHPCFYFPLTASIFQGHKIGSATQEKSLSWRASTEGLQRGYRGTSGNRTHNIAQIPEETGQGAGKCLMLPFSGGEAEGDLACHRCVPNVCAFVHTHLYFSMCICVHTARTQAHVTVFYWGKGGFMHASAHPHALGWRSTGPDTLIEGRQSIAI